MRPGNSRNKATAGIAAVVAVATIAVLTVVTGNQAQANAGLPGDGTTSATAGASCWGIKTQYGSSPSDTYWLNTAILARPQQFYCDMTTDGGGWVLVGRGREGWSFNPLGQGSAATVRAAVDGPSAFAPAALDAETIAALLNGTGVDALPDGIRLERATNSNGSSRQDYRLYPKYQNWNWSFPGGNLLNKVVIDGKTYNGSNTADTAATAFGQTTNGLSGKQKTDRMYTTAWSAHNNLKGFALGSSTSGGSNSSSNYLWTYTTEGSPIPFTRVWLRPQIANSAAGFTPLPTTGLAPQPRAAVLNSKSQTAPWGVVGMDHTNEDLIEPWNTNVLTVKTASDRVFVGGRFTGVQNGPTATAVAQPYLAAFDLDGNWISTFRPTINGRVWRAILTPDNKLIIGGDFTSVNGAPNTSGMAALDPATGQVIPTWKTNIAKADGTRPLVRALDLRGDTIYVGGSFNRVTAGSWNTISTSNAVSLNANTGDPGGWRPRTSGSIVDLSATADGSRVLMAGWFNRVNDDYNHGYFAITDSSTGNPVPGIGTWQPSHTSAKYQQAVADLGERVLVGGSQHNFQMWTKDRTQLIDSSITKKGGDTQAIEVFDGKAYWGCHCGNYVYQGSNNFSSPTGFRSVDAINLVGAVDTDTFAYDTRWYPSSLKGDRGEGVWAIDKDSRGCLWVGGDLIRGAYSGNAANDWLGGFARFCGSDTTVPTTPTNLAATASGEGVTLNWGASTDESGSVSYDIYRNDRVIATQWNTTFTDPSVSGTQRYTVRATDARGNRSGAPAPVNVNGPAPKIATAIAFGSPGRYLDNGSDQGTAWRQVGFDDNAWKSGPGLFGWGVSGLGSTMTNKPQTAYVRSTFTVADPAAVRVLDLKIKAATGAVVYVNGTEAGRINMGSGAVTSTTPAAGYIWGSAESAIHTLTVPGTLLRSGTNTVAIEVHSMTVNAGRAFTDVQATTYGNGGDSTAPTPPAVTAVGGAGSVQLTWTAGSDETALGGYLISRDGEPIAITNPMSLGFVDGTVDTATAHTYVVTAFDTNANTAASAPVTVAPQTNPNLLGYGSQWRWTYPETALVSGWQGAGYDDSTWAVGNAELGYGDSDEATVISTAPAPRPVTAYFRTTINVTDPAAFTTVLAEMIRDDGIVVYVNGVEIGRDNLPAGAIDGNILASRGISIRAEEKTPVAMTFPAGTLTPGNNVIAVEVHNADRWSGDLSFDLMLRGQK